MALLPAQNLLHRYSSCQLLRLKGTASRRLQAFALVHLQSTPASFNLETESQQLGVPRLTPVLLLLHFHFLSTQIVLARHTSPLLRAVVQGFAVFTTCKAPQQVPGRWIPPPS